jgi:hypothetical protein
MGSCSSLGERGRTMPPDASRRRVVTCLREAKLHRGKIPMFPGRCLSRCVSG